MQGRGVDQANPECQAQFEGDLWIRETPGARAAQIADFPPVIYELLR